MTVFEDISAFNGEIFNLGAENLKIIEIAEIIKDLMKSRYNRSEIRIEESNDPRSYHINSDKIQNVLKFQFKHTVRDAIKDLLDQFDNGNLKDSFEEKWSNISTLKKIKIF